MPRRNWRTLFTIRLLRKKKRRTRRCIRRAVLTVHYQAQITDGNDVYAMMKTGTYNSCSPAGAWFSQNAACGPNTWNTMIWNEARFSWINNQLTQIWIYATDWKPEPNGNGLQGWEPVFHPVDANNFIYVPGAGGTIWKVNKTTGVSASHINPFSGTNITRGRYICGGSAFRRFAGQHLLHRDRTCGSEPGRSVDSE